MLYTKNTGTMIIPPGERVDAVNIALMLLAALIALFIPFELFLFSYAVLGPLHYLTEISWLHDKKYYTRGRYDAWFLVLIALAITLVYFNGLYKLLPKLSTSFDLPKESMNYLAWIALLSALLFALVKNRWYRIAGFVVILASLSVSTWSTVGIYLTIFLPTLLHVYVFTGLFMLYGAMKSKSRLGIVSVILLVLCPVALFLVTPDLTVLPVSEASVQAYIGGDKGIGFISVHMQALNRFFHYNPQPVIRSQQEFDYWMNAVFNTPTSILLTRCIAFAYTYHYLNWFSKTRVIKWHKVPKKRFAVVILFWIISLGLYRSSYQLGLQWLFLLSYLHVLLELPLNVTSFAGIVQGIRQGITKGRKAVKAEAAK